MSEEQPSNFSTLSIKTIHLEITEKCNASCPSCGRNILGGELNPHLSMASLSLQDIQSIFPISLVRQMKKIYLCGNYGDPAANPVSLEAIRYFHEAHPGLQLGMNSNGSLQAISWWEELASYFQENKSSVKFAIDGLEDTNHLYRVGVSWSKLMDRVKAFIGAGGTADWHYIVFKHNEHQVEEARELAKELGFRHFVVKNTGRFFDPDTGKVIEKLPYINHRGETTHYLEMPGSAQFRNAGVEDLKKVKEEYNSMTDYYNQAQIRCKAMEDSAIYVSAEGLVFPCCWTASELYPSSRKITQKSALARWIEGAGGKECLSARHHSIEEIVSGPLFNRIEQGWSDETAAEDKLRVCSKICGHRIKPFDNQYVHDQLKTLK